MPIFVGSQKIAQIFVGAQEIKEVYDGGTLVFQNDVSMDTGLVTQTVGKGGYIDEAFKYWWNPEPNLVDGNSNTAAAPLVPAAGTQNCWCRAGLDNWLTNAAEIVDYGIEVKMQCGGGGQDVWVQLLDTGITGPRITLDGGSGQITRTITIDPGEDNWLNHSQADVIVTAGAYNNLIGSDPDVLAFWADPVAFFSTITVVGQLPASAFIVKLRVQYIAA